MNVRATLTQRAAARNRNLFFHSVRFIYGAAFQRPLQIRMAIKDRTGQRSGRLTVVRFAPERSTPKRKYWLAQCECGGETFLRTDAIGEIFSCGCAHREGLIERLTTHGMTGHPAHRIWGAMHRRCNPNSKDAKNQRNYVARGITVCERWQSFEAFWEDMGPTWKDGLTIERRDNSKGYEPGNCVWATYAMQNLNTRRNRIIMTPRGPMAVSEAAKVFGIGGPTLRARLRAGHTGDDLWARPHTMRGDPRHTYWKVRPKKTR